jgi:hypothetical protein
MKGVHKTARQTDKRMFTDRAHWVPASEPPQLHTVYTWHQHAFPFHYENTLHYRYHHLERDNTIVI